MTARPTPELDQVCSGSLNAFILDRLRAGQLREKARVSLEDSASHAGKLPTLEDCRTNERVSQQRGEKKCRGGVWVDERALRCGRHSPRRATHDESGQLLNDRARKEGGHMRTGQANEQ